MIDNDLNNDIVMAWPFDLINESLVINETNSKKLVNKKFNQMSHIRHPRENYVESQINYPSMNKMTNMKKQKIIIRRRKTTKEKRKRLIQK